MAYSGRIDRVADGLGKVYIYFNNDVGGHAIANARTLAGMLRAQLPAPV